MHAPTITGGPVNRTLQESAGLDQTDVQITDTGTFTVEDLDTSNVVNANSSFTGVAPTPIPLSIRSSMTSSTSALTPSSMRPQTRNPQLEL